MLVQRSSFPGTKTARNEVVATTRASKAAWMVAVGLALSSCSADDPVPGDALTPSVAPQASHAESTTSTPEPTTSPSEPTTAAESTAGVIPALPEISVEFEERASRVLAVLSDWGYDTSTGESDSPSVMSRHLTPISAESDLPTMALSLEWGQSVPYGDRQTVGTVEADSLSLNVLRMGGERAGVWFTCDRMIVVLSAKVSLETLSNSAVALHRDGCL